MLETLQSLAIIGCGTLGEAILKGLLRSGKVTPEQVVVTARRAEVRSRLSDRYRVEALASNLDACKKTEVALVSLKPQQLASVLDNPQMREALAGKLVISVAAGVSVEQLSDWLTDSAVIRAMPNTPCFIGEGMTIIARGTGVTDQQAQIASAIFKAVGRCIELEDKHMDAVTALNSSGPAFACVILEALADGGVMMGLRRDVAIEIAAQMFQGTARMVLESGFHPAALKDQVTTPAGCTIAGLLTMEDGRIRSVLARAVEEGTRVASRLGKK